MGYIFPPLSKGRADKIKMNHLLIIFQVSFVWWWWYVSLVSKVVIHVSIKWRMLMHLDILIAIFSKFFNMLTMETYCWWPMLWVWVRRRWWWWWWFLITEFWSDISIKYEDNLIQIFFQSSHSWSFPISKIFSIINFWWSESRRWNQFLADF